MTLRRAVLLALALLLLATPVPAKKKKAVRKKTVRRSRFKAPEPARVKSVLKILNNLYPDANTALDFKSPLQLLIATILSAQCTDARVNMVTPGLFKKYPTAKALAADRGIVRPSLSPESSRLCDVLAKGLLVFLDEGAQPSRVGRPV